MGTPSDGKKYAPDRYCVKCNDILIGDEKTICDDCIVEALDRIIARNEKSSKRLYCCADDDITDGITDELAEIVSTQAELAELIKFVKKQLDK